MNKYLAQVIARKAIDFVELKTPTPYSFKVKDFRTWIEDIFKKIEHEEDKTLKKIWTDMALADMEKKIAKGDFLDKG